jgi:hypothetical protein
MRALTSCVVLAITIAATGLAWSVDRANAADAWRSPDREYRHGPTRLVVPAPTWCRSGWDCGDWDCWKGDCSPQYYARHDDAWCLYHGPRGSAVYDQCRENRYYDRLSLPLRVTK